jgi:transcriptional regulator with XRE-family HTH domain
MTNITKSSQKLGREIQKHRKAKGYSQEQLAELANISRAHMGHIEQGRKTPSVDLLEKIAKALKIKVRDIFPF